MNTSNIGRENKVFGRNIKVPKPEFQRRIILKAHLGKIHIVKEKGRDGTYRAAPNKTKATKDNLFCMFGIVFRCIEQSLAEGVV